MIVEGVFAGNQGPLFYGSEHITKSVSGWNHKPITVGHPQLGGVHVSGCAPQSIEDFSVGIILNASWNSKSKKLRAEAWFEETRLDVVPGGNSIRKALETGQPLEVSTGLFVDNEMSSGNWQGKEYIARATNFRPDHLAIILNGEGACSLKDGAGLLVNAAENAIKSQILSLTNNKLSPSLIVKDVENDTVYFCVGNETFQENFTIVANEVKLKGNRTKVVRHVSYTPLVTKSKADMDRETLLKALGDDHKDFVTNMTDAQVEALSALEVKVEVEKVVEKEIIKEVPVTNSVANLDELLALAPEALKAQVQEALTVNENRRKELIEQIIANEKNQFSAEELAGMASETLVKLSVLAVNAAPAKPAPKYAGSGAQEPPKVEVKGFLPPSTFVPKSE